jgi:hypothetical protein
VLSVLWVAAIVAISSSDRRDLAASTIPKSAQIIGHDVNGDPVDENGDVVRANPEPQSFTRYWGIKSALIFTPPLAGYLILFGLLPWIGRGFRSTHL